MKRNHCLPSARVQDNFTFNSIYRSIFKTKKKWKIKLEIVWERGNEWERGSGAQLSPKTWNHAHTHITINTYALHSCNLWITTAITKQKERNRWTRPTVNCVHSFERNEKCSFQWMLNWHDVMMDVIRVAVVFWFWSQYTHDVCAKLESKQDKEMPTTNGQYIAMSWSRSKSKPALLYETQRGEETKKNLNERNRKCILAMRQTHLISLFCILMSKNVKFPAPSFNVFSGFWLKPNRSVH